MAQRHVQLLEDEFGTTPDPQLAAFAERLKRAADPSAIDTTASVPKLGEPWTAPLPSDRTELARFGQRPSGNAQFLLDRRQEDPQHPRGEWCS